MNVSSVHWKDQCWSWNSNTLATWCEQLTYLKRPWCWERLRARGEGEDRGWDGWMASLTRWTWVWVNSRSWRWTGRPGVLRFRGSQRVGDDWTELEKIISTLKARPEEKSRLKHWKPEQWKRHIKEYEPYGTWWINVINWNPKKKRKSGAKAIYEETESESLQSW